MAAAYVSGIAALLLSQNTNLSTGELKAKIEQNTCKLNSLEGKVSTIGMANAYNAVTGQGQTIGPVINIRPGVSPTPIQGINQYFGDVEIPPFVLINKSLKFTDAISAYKYIQVIIWEKGSKEVTYDFWLENGQKELNLDRLIPEKEYCYNIKVTKDNNVIDSYIGEFQTNPAINGGDVLLLEASPVTSNIFLSSYDASTSVTQSVYSSSLNENASVTDAVYGNRTLSVTDTDYGDENKTVTGSVYGQSKIYDAGALATRYEVESNDSFGLADRIYSDDDAYGTISSSTDIDYFKVMFDSNGKANFWLGSVPAGCDYDIYLYDENKVQLKCSENAKSADELIEKYSVTANKWYYIKVMSYTGEYNSYSYYHLRTKNYPESVPSPTVRLTSPLNGSTYSLGQSITISATGTNCHHISAFVNNISVASNEEASYGNGSGNYFSCSYTPTLPGTYRIYVKGNNMPQGDPNAIITQSSYVYVTVVGPVVRLDSPVNGANYVLGQSITISSTGSNCHHIAAFVKGPNDTDYKWVADNTGNNFSYNYSPSNAGTYSICVKGRNTENATDPGSQLVVSNAVTLTVSAPTTPTGTAVTLSSGMLSQSGLTAFNASACMDNITNGAWHTDSSISGAYLKVDFGAGNEKSIISVGIEAMTAGYRGNYGIEYSNDNSTWTTVANNFIPNSAGWNCKNWNQSSSHRYWRLYLTNTPGGGSWLCELKLYSISSATPDLTITDLSWSPSSPIVGNTVTLTAKVSNNGTGSTPSSTVHRVDFYVDGSQAASSTGYTSSIPAGSYANITANWTATAGTHSVQAVVDPSGAIAESNENNNWSTQKGISIQGPGTWYYIEIPNNAGGTTKIGLSDIGSIGSTSSNVQACVKRNNGPWISYTLNNGTWSLGSELAFAPWEGGNVGVASDDSRVGTMAILDNIDYEGIKSRIKNEILTELEIVESDLSTDDLNMIYYGILIGVDDNLTFGIGQWANNVNYLPEDNYYFMRAKTYTDTAFVAFFAQTALGSASAAAAFLADSGRAALCAAATSPTGVGTAVFGTEAVGELAAAGFCAGISILTTTLSERSYNILNVDMIKLRSIPRWYYFKGIKARKVTKKSVEEVNAWWREKGYNDPYKPGTEVYEFELAENTTLYRVYHTADNTAEGSKLRGQFLLKLEDIEGLTAEQIKNKFALPDLPNYLGKCELEAGSRLRVGIAKDQLGWGSGGGIQFDLMGDFIGEFSCVRNL